MDNVNIVNSGYNIVFPDAIYEHHIVVQLKITSVIYSANPIKMVVQ